MFYLSYNHRGESFPLSAVFEDSKGNHSLCSSWSTELGYETQPRLWFETKEEAASFAAGIKGARLSIAECSNSRVTKNSVLRKGPNGLAFNNLA